MKLDEKVAIRSGNFPGYQRPEGQAAMLDRDKLQKLPRKKEPGRGALSSRAEVHTGWRRCSSSPLDGREVWFAQV